MNWVHFKPGTFQTMLFSWLILQQMESNKVWKLFALKCTSFRYLTSCEDLMKFNKSTALDNHIKTKIAWTTNLVRTNNRLVLNFLLLVIFLVVCVTTSQQAYLLSSKSEEVSIQLEKVYWDLKIQWNPSMWYMWVTKKFMWFTKITFWIHLSAQNPKTFYFLIHFQLSCWSRINSISELA